MKKFLGVICMIYSLIIGYVIIFDKLKLFLAPNMHIYIKASILPLIIMGIILMKTKNDKFKISDLLLLLPIIMIILCGDGKLSTTYAQKKTIVKDKTVEKKKIIKEKQHKDEVIEDNSEEIEFDKDNLDIYFDVIDKNYVDLSGYITFAGDKYDQFINKTIKVRGIAITKGEYIPEGYFQIGKYAMTCCAADAALSGFYVKTSDYEIKDNNWYEIEGVLRKFIYKNMNIMYIKIINIKEIDSSKEEQYVYPCYSYDDGSCKEFLKYNLEY